MALMATIDRDIPLVGIVSVPSYCKVVSLAGGKHGMEAAMVAAKDNADGEMVCTFHVQFVPDLNGPNFIAQAYAHFKALPQLAGATDC